MSLKCTGVIIPIYETVPIKCKQLQSKCNTDDGSCQYCDLSYNIYVNQTTSNTNCDGWYSYNGKYFIPPITYSWYDNNNNLISNNNNISSICIGNYSVSVIDIMDVLLIPSLM